MPKHGDPFQKGQLHTMLLCAPASCAARGCSPVACSSLGVARAGGFGNALLIEWAVSWRAVLSTVEVVLPAFASLCQPLPHPHHHHHSVLLSRRARYQSGNPFARGLSHGYVYSHTALLVYHDHPPGRMFLIYSVTFPEPNFCALAELAAIRKILPAGVCVYEPSSLS